ncbi:MAG: hypothetical protein K2K80_02510, partial [Clostridia bacterium]|nr:hypothetical protein [Clostridia bacterium]
LPDTFETDLDFLGDGTEINEKTYKNDFLFQYLNRLRVISYLPDGILKLVKDKRLLALGYAEKEVKKEILKFAKPVFDKAMTICEKQSEASIQAEKGLTIHEQFKTRPYSSSLPYLFDGVEITKVEKVDGDIYLTLDEYDTVVFSGAKIIEEETDILNSCVIDIELYKKENCHELHFLLRKINDNLIENYYYATYEFKDMKFKD